MCGIVGIANRDRPVCDRGWLREACHALAHRGPDDAGEWWTEDGRVGLGHRRLAIIDLSAAGHQPMRLAGEPLWIVFNGEIYNFDAIRAELAARGATFESRSDTEVILAAYREWGTDSIRRLEGMFAFALFDAARGVLFLARDRAGEKPVFYSLRDGELRFASELKALMRDAAMPRRVSPNALDCYLAFGFVPGDGCILEGVRKLPPAHALHFDLRSGDLRTWRYWEPPPQAATARGADADELTSELEHLLASAVSRQLVADVPVGVLLSGGLDSSLVTAMAARATQRVKTFTIRFPGHGVFDETQHARLVASHFGTEHVELEAEDTTVTSLETLARQFDEPIIDSSMIPTLLVSRLTRRHCTVALGGDGGDELFGGYRQYPRLLRLQRMARGVPRGVRAAAAAVTAHLPVGTRGRNWVLAAAANFASDLPAIGEQFDRRTRARLMGGEQRWPLVAERVRRERLPTGADLLDRATRFDFNNYLPEDILVKVDRASMLTSLEVRAPMLDPRLIEFAFARVPSRLKTTTAERKILLRRLAGRVLPPSFDATRKQGFSIPLDSWLRTTAWQSYFRDVLLDRGQTTFDHTVVREMIDGQSARRSNGERLFGLVMFELWRRAYGMELGDRFSTDRNSAIYD